MEQQPPRPIAAGVRRLVVVRPPPRRAGFCPHRLNFEPARLEGDYGVAVAYQAAQARGALVLLEQPHAGLLDLLLDAVGIGAVRAGAPSTRGQASIASTPLRNASLKVGNWATASLSTSSEVPVLITSAA
jgi:hypothetical protein